MRASSRTRFPVGEGKVNKQNRFMERALELARHAETQGEVPVGAVLVLMRKSLGRLESANPPARSQRSCRNYGSAPCRAISEELPPAGFHVIRHPRTLSHVRRRHRACQGGQGDLWGLGSAHGAAGSVFDLLPSDARFNHRTEVSGGLMADQSADLLRQFFRARRR